MWSMATALMISYSGMLGGAERALIDFSAGLEAESWLACPAGALAAAARERGIRVFTLPSLSLDIRASPRDRVLSAWRLARHRRTVRALIRDLRPSLVIASGMRSALASLLPSPVRPGPPVVFDHHDLLPGPLIGALVRTAARRAALVVVPSHAVADDLRARGPVAVVPPGVELEQFGDLEAPASPPCVLVLGAVVPWKRPELALEAAAIARRERPDLDLRLRFAGAPLGAEGDALLERLRSRAREPDLAGAVEFAGAVTNPAPELARAMCLLHCAPCEPFGLVLVEALAAGRPAVAPAACGPLEIVDETCGVRYPPGDAHAAARALLRLAGDPSLAASLGAGGRARARERFDVRVTRGRFAAAVGIAGAEPPARTAGRGLAIVTVTYNSATELDALLHSVAAQLPCAHVIVVDCASSDHTLEVAREHPELAVEVLALERNVGFGAACNRGVAAVSEPVVALVNPDVELVDDSLLELAEEARANERLLAPLVLSSDGSRQDTVHPSPTSIADVARAIVPSALVGGQAGIALAPWRSELPRRVGWAVGCALVSRTETLARLGPFDERIFLYGEDLDLGLRADAAGVQTWFWPTARVLHARAHSTGRAFGGEPFERLARARRETVKRRLGGRRRFADDLAQAATFCSRIALKQALRRPAERERLQLAALRAARRSPGTSTDAAGRPQ
jgi:GT2 family glycosyltransferase/glycosyltransferase involved in cell wall biosynthesis